MRHDTVPFEHTRPEVSIPRGWVILALLLASWLIVIGLVQLVLQLLAFMTGS